MMKAGNMSGTSGDSATSHSSSFLTTRMEDRILFVTLDRPEALNACDEQDHREMAQIAGRIAADDAVDVVVVTGEGRAFCVGGHKDLIGELITDEAVRGRVEYDARTMIHSLAELDKPLIVALNGYAMGAGLAFALMGDIIIAERGAKFADGHVLLGMAAGDGGAITWPLYAGLLRAKRWLLTGDWITAEDAERVGLVTELVDKGRSLERATEFARQLAALPQEPIRYTKRSLNQWLKAGIGTAFDLSCGYEFKTLGSAATAAQIKKIMGADANA
jgi:enoyl-CoA hydratase